MAGPSVPAPRQTVRARITSKGQITVPASVRMALGVKSGDSLRFEPQEGGYRVLRDVEVSVFEKWRGIGTGFAIPGYGREALVAFFREMHGHDQFD